MTPRLLAMAVALALTAGCAAATTYAVDRTYNRFTDETRVLLRPHPLTMAAVSDGSAVPAVTLSAAFYSKGMIDIQRPEAITLALETTGQDWQLKNDRTLTLQADGETIALGTLGHDGTRRNGQCYEYLWVDVPVATFETLAKAESLAGQVGRFAFSVDATLRQRLREFAERIPVAGKANGGTKQSPVLPGTGLIRLTD